MTLDSKNHQEQLKSAGQVRQLAELRLNAAKSEASAAKKRYNQRAKAVWQEWHRGHDIQRIDRMSGREFERFLKQLLEHVGYRKVQLTGVNDFGADLTCTDDAGIRIAVQAKRQKQNVGVQAIQEVAGAMRFYNCSIGCVITNSFFTQPAKAMVANDHGLRLFDRSWLTEQIRRHFATELPPFDENEFRQIGAIYSKCHSERQSLEIAKQELANAENAFRSACSVHEKVTAAAAAARIASQPSVLQPKLPSPTYSQFTCPDCRKTARCNGRPGAFVRCPNCSSFFQLPDGNSTPRAVEPIPAEKSPAPVAPQPQVRKPTNSSASHESGLLPGILAIVLSGLVAMVVGSQFLATTWIESSPPKVSHASLDSHAPSTSVSIANDESSAPTSPPPLFQSMPSVTSVAPKTDAPNSPPVEAFRSETMAVQKPTVPRNAYTPYQSRFGQPTAPPTTARRRDVSRFASANTKPIARSTHGGSLYTGRDLYLQGDFNSAIKHFEDASRCQTNDAAPLYLMAMAYERLGNAAEAESSLQRAATIETVTPMQDWGTLMERVQGRHRAWLEQNRKQHLAKQRAEPQRKHGFASGMDLLVHELSDSRK